MKFTMRSNSVHFDIIHKYTSHDYSILLYTHFSKIHVSKTLVISTTVIRFKHVRALDLYLEHKNSQYPLNKNSFKKAFNTIVRRCFLKNTKRNIQL